MSDTRVARGEGGERRWEVGGGKRDPWSVTIDQSRLPIPPLNLKSNDQITWAGGEDAMDEDEAREQWIVTTMRCRIDRVAPLPSSTYKSTIS